MNATEPAFLESVVAKLAAAYRPKAIYLFGSQARGTVRADSDIDLLVIVDRVLRPLGRAVDVLIWRHSKFIEESKSRTSLPGTVMREGVLLYAD